jgi:hypothetical protein
MTKIEQELMTIETMIYVIRGQRVMIDNDLAALYGVETKVLNQAVKRNNDRFPEDFLFQLNEEEAESLRCQTGISKEGKGGRRYHPKVFTENGVAMLSSVLNSSNAIQVNIAIMRTFTKLRSFLAMENSINNRMEKMESNSTKLFKHVFERLDDLEGTLIPSIPKTRKKIGLKTEL